MTLPRNNPTSFCRAFIQRELTSYKEASIWGSYWNTMELLINRSRELTLAFDELIASFGYSDKFEGSPPTNSYIWLVLEHLWCSIDFRKELIVNAREHLKELELLQNDITKLALELSEKLTRQSELYDASGFIKSDIQTLDEMLELASTNNNLYQSYISKEISSLFYQYDSKYWPTRADLVSAIAEFEEQQPSPSHIQYPDIVLDGRESNIKDFVIAFDNKFDEHNGLPTGFRFSNNAMADVVNVVLELPVNKMASGDTVRNIRNRFKEKPREKPDKDKG